MKHEVGTKDLATLISYLVKQVSIGGSCCVPYEDLGGNKRIALVFVACDHIENKVLFDMFTEAICAWIDVGLLNVPTGYLEWERAQKLSPN